MREFSLSLAHQPLGDADTIDWTAVREDPDALTEAVGRLYRAYVDRVYRYCGARVGNPADAEDLTTQIFIEVLEGLPRYRHRGHFAAWLFSIARRRVADYYRRRRPCVSLDAMLPVAQALIGGPSQDPLNQAIRSETRQRLVDMLASLTGEERELLGLRFAADLTYGEMAHVLGRSEGAVKMATHRLLSRLQTRWEEVNDD